MRLFHFRRFILNCCSCLFILFFFSGCGTLHVNINKDNKPFYHCQISIIDDRPDKRIFSNGLFPIEVSPTLENLFMSKLCVNEKIKTQLIATKTEVHIEDVKLNRISSLFSDEYILEFIGYLTKNNEMTKIRSYGLSYGTMGGVWSFMPPLIDNSADDLVSKIEKHFSQNAQ